MAGRIVCKFGGSSVADAGQIEKVRRIVEANPKRRIVVVSAPGRSSADEQKVTDHLINIATDGSHFREQRLDVTPAQSKQAVLNKFTTIVEDLSLEADDILAALKADLDCSLSGDERVAFLASRGEHYNARLIAAYFERCGMEASAGLPEDIGLVVSDDFLNADLQEETYRNIRQLADDQRLIVVPGFYGVTGRGQVAVFSRGGSDLTGGEIAYAVDAETYENWTDVSGVFEADPRQVPEARAIPRLTFKEIRLLSCKGFNVFHLNAMLPCKDRKIPIHIRNTNEPQDPGTVILFERVPEEGVVGIAQLDNVAYVYLEKDMLGEETGFTAELLTILREFNIQTYHYPTDKDDIAVLVNQDDLTGAINDLRQRIEEQLRPDFMNVAYNLSILTPVGLGLQGNTYPIVDALSALGEAHIPIETIDQSPSQICFHIGVPQAVADDALRILYRTLIG
ncbi:MAG: aspartate kinase [Marinobacter sp.]|uniref:aspartate kinase n=1 Tax=Marinobacter sp. TaxID=50741 RepID=UPI00299F1CCE|nr:aspartate kinase [Marinobacter sp.]MDX1757517.1 aspartate kinase [Marinobacter sp.]